MIKKINRDLINSIDNCLSALEKELNKDRLRYFNKFKQRYKNDLLLIDKYLQGKKILEIGAYPFHLTYCLKKLKYRVNSVDIEPKREEVFFKKAWAKLSQGKY